MKRPIIATPPWPWPWRRPRGVLTRVFGGCESADLGVERDTVCGSDGGPLLQVSGGIVHCCWRCLCVILCIGCSVKDLAFCFLDAGEMLWLCSVGVGAGASLLFSCCQNELNPCWAQLLVELNDV